MAGRTWTAPDGRTDPDGPGRTRTDPGRTRTDPDGLWTDRTEFGWKELGIRNFFQTYLAPPPPIKLEISLPAHKTILIRTFRTSYERKAYTLL